MNSPLTFGDVLRIVEAVAVLATAIIFIIRMGGKIDRLSDAVNNLASSFRDHEDRLRVLERGSVSNGDYLSVS